MDFQRVVFKWVSGKNINDFIYPNLGGRWRCDACHKILTGDCFHSENDLDICCKCFFHMDINVIVENVHNHCLTPLNMRTLYPQYSCWKCDVCGDLKSKKTRGLHCQTCGDFDSCESCVISGGMAYDTHTPKKLFDVKKDEKIKDDDDESTLTCDICFQNRKRIAAIHNETAHVFGCFSCSNKLIDNNIKMCPLCGKKFEKLVCLF